MIHDSNLFRIASATVGGFVIGSVVTFIAIDVTVGIYDKPIEGKTYQVTDVERIKLLATTILGGVPVAAYGCYLAVQKN